MLIEWQLRGIVVELLEIAAEPVRERRVDPLDRFGPRVARATGSRAAAAGLQGNNQGDPLIERSGQQGRLAVARMSDDGNTAGIDIVPGRLLEKIDHAVK